MKTTLYGSRLTAALVLTVMILSSCASTASKKSTAARPGADAVESPAAGAPDAAASGATEAPGAPSSKKSRATAKGGAGGTAPGAPGAARNLVMGHGITADKIQLGIVWIDLNAYFAVVNAAFGTSAQNPSSSSTTKDWADAVIKHQNARGGLLGRKIEPVYYEQQTQDLLSPQGRAQSEQQMCAKFTQDTTVFAIVPLESNEGVILQCAKKADTLVIGTSNTDENLDQDRFGEVGAWYFKPNWLSGERRERAMVQRLTAQGWFGPNPSAAKVGIMVEDKPQYRRPVDKALIPALKSLGVQLGPVIAWPDQVESPWDNYVLQMNTAGVTHVIWSGCGCSAIPPGLFMRGAENQRWKAKHALGSEYLLRGMPTIAPANQLDGMGGIGWGPEFDYGADRAWKETAFTPADDECRKAMQASGIKVTGGMYCEFIFFLRAALQRAPALTRAGVTEGAEGLGSSYVPVGTPAAVLGRGRHDGTSAVWDVVFDRACSCIRYNGPPHAIG